MPDDQQGPRLDLSRRSAWIAGAAALGLVAATAAVVWVVASTGRSPSAITGGPDSSSATVETVPTSPAPAGNPPRKAHRGHRGHRLRAPIRPVRIHRDPGCPVRPPRILRVMQFNIHAGLSRSGRVDLVRIAAEIEAARPDVVSLNEVDSGTLRSDGIDEPAYLSRATGMRAVYGPNLEYDGGRFGNAILSRFPVRASHNTSLPGRPHSERRGLLEATLRVGGRTVSFYSVHLSQGRRGAVPRARQAEAISRVLRRSPHPTILAGDLNSRPGDLPVRILRQYLLDAQQYGGTGRGLTVPEAHPRSRIDYILYDNSFAPLRDSTRVRSSEASDHRSLETELVLRPKGQC